MDIRLRTAALLLAFAAAGFSDMLKFRDGKTIRGTWMGGDARTVVFETDGHTQRYPIAQVQTIIVEDGTPATPLSNDQPSPPTAPMGSAVGASTGQPASPVAPPASSKQIVVAGVSGGETYITMGSNVGLKAGQTLKLYRVTSVSGSTDDRGTTPARRQLVCTLTLRDVEETSASGTCQGDTPARLDIAEPAK
jgi:hypothetical protein